MQRILEFFSWHIIELCLVSWCRLGWRFCEPQLAPASGLGTDDGHLGLGEHRVRKGSLHQATILVCCKRTLKRGVDMNFRDVQKMYLNYLKLIHHSDLWFYIHQGSWSLRQSSASGGPDVDYAEIKAATLAVMAKDVATARRSLQEWGQITFWVDKAGLTREHGHPFCSLICFIWNCTFRSFNNIFIEHENWQF